MIFLLGMGFSASGMSFAVSRKEQVLQNNKQELFTKKKEKKQELDS